jgi:hypothetical protein
MSHPAKLAAVACAVLTSALIYVGGSAHAERLCRTNFGTCPTHAPPGTFCHCASAKGDTVGRVVDVSPSPPPLHLPVHPYVGGGVRPPTPNSSPGHNYGGLPKSPANSPQPTGPDVGPRSPTPDSSPGHNYGGLPKSPGSSPQPKPVAGPRSPIEQNAPPKRILETGYGLLFETGTEVAGYGLYSYAVVISDTDASATFLGEIFKSIPSVGNTAAQPSQLNIFYVPMNKKASAGFESLVHSSQGSTAELGRKISGMFYDYKVARAILDHICNPPAQAIRDLCDGDMSRGPYIFTYAKPASMIEPVPPPFLFVDLSDVKPEAYAEFIAAFRAQVKRDDFSDGARVNSLRLKLLNLAITAADIIGPVQKAIADIVRSETTPDQTDSK